jgi:hypothetical protein
VAHSTDETPQTRYSNWSNGDLVQAVTIEGEQHYKSEALEEMRRELAARKISEEEWNQLRKRLALVNSVQNHEEGNSAAEEQLRNGANWFYWLAGLSLANSVVALLGANFVLIFGLGFTQIVDAIVAGVAQERPELTQLVVLVGLGVTIVSSGFFALLGWYANQKRQWAFILGLVLYALDAGLALLFGAYLSLAFHAWVLLALFQGLKALGKLRTDPSVEMAPA